MSHLRPVHEIRHPLVSHHLAKLRDKNASPAAFRAAMERLTHLVAYEATADLTLTPKQVDTPLETMTCEVLTQRIGIVPILRAGLGMVEPMLTILPDAEVWHLGFYRDESTLQPVEYYQKLPKLRPVDVAMVLDPMLATGGSAVAALESVIQWGVPRVKLLSILAAPEGVKKVSRTFPEVEIYVATVDRELNDLGYILPGLGDAGDRIFNAQAV
jgi:uracil phosphoribosyltransferase